MNIEKAVKNLLKSIDILDPSGENRKLYETTIKRMSKSELEEWCNKIKTKELKISVIFPNGDKRFNYNREKINSLLKRFDIEIFKRVTFTDHKQSKFTPDHTFNILLLPVVRLNQHITSKMGIAKHNYKRNPLTDQVTSESKAGSISLPELFILNGLGLEEVVDEIASIRGGDRRAMEVLENDLITNGKVSKEELKRIRTKASAVKRLNSYFKALHIDINL